MFLASLVAACDASDPAHGSGTDAATTDAAAAGDAGAPDDAAGRADGATSCVDRIGSCPAQSFGKWTVLLDAADFGDEARLVALGGQVVLVRSGDGTFRLVQIDDNYDDADTTYSSWDFPTGDLVPFAVADGASSTRDRVLFVLACDTDGARCKLSQARSSQGQLSAWQSTDLPAGFQASGLVFDGTSEPAICAYGNGLLCLRESWEEAIAQEPGLRINDVAIGAPWSLAVGNGGRWFKRDSEDLGRPGTWQEQPTLGDAALTQVSAVRSGAVVVGDGTLQAALGEQAQYFSCGAPEELLALMLVHASPDLAFGVTSAGTVLQHPPPRLGSAEPFCAYDQLPAGPVRDVSSSYCMDSLNPRVLLDRVVFGQNVCLRIF